VTAAEIAVAGELKAVVDDGKNAYVCSVDEQPRAGTVRSANDLVYAVRAHTRSGAIGNSPAAYGRHDYFTDYALFIIARTQQARK